MEDIQLILTIAIPIYSFLVIFFGIWLGHKLTIKAFSHVQPSTKEMAKMSKGTVTTEPDWFDEALKDQPPDMTPEKESAIRKLFKKTGLPESIFDSYKKSGRDPQEFFGYDVPYNKQSVEEEIDKGNNNGN